MRHFRLLVCFLAALSLTSVPVEAAQESQGATYKKAVKKAGVKRAKIKAKARHKHSAKANPKRIISTIRANKAYHTPVAATSQGGESGTVFSAANGELRLASSKALIVNQNTGETIYAKSTNVPAPIASLTKLMTAMVLLDQQLPMEESISVGYGDVDMLKGTSSRLRVGTTLTRQEMLQLALMSSENRAASALARTSPLGAIGFVDAMNRKALELGMLNTRFADPTGLNSENVSTAEDLVKMVKAAYQYPEIRIASTSTEREIPVAGYRRPLEFRNTNVLVRNGNWDIGLSKTGYINEAGRCLVMQAQIADQPLIIVLLDSWGKYTRIGDAQRIRKWIESSTGSRHTKVG